MWVISFSFSLWYSLKHILSLLTMGEEKAKEFDDIKQEQPTSASAGASHNYKSSNENSCCECCGICLNVTSFCNKNSL